MSAQCDRSEIARRELATDDEILRLLFSSPAPWSVDELVRELANTDAEDGVVRLVGAGLAHRQGELVSPTRAARRAVELYEPF